MNRVYIARLTGSELTAEEVANALDWIGWQAWLPTDSKVFLKPNLTWPTHIPGVTTTPKAIEAIIAALSTRTRRITVGESDGGYHSFTAEESLAGHGVYELQKKYSIRVINLSKEFAEEVCETVLGSPVRIILPRLLLRETDVFITIPVPKVHVMTGVSLAFKNQWGCNPSTMRLRDHPEFERKIIAINRRLAPRVIMDGTFFLDGAGPLSGNAIRKNVFLAANSVGAADTACCEVMGIRPDEIRHLHFARRTGMLPSSKTDLLFNQPLDSFCGNKFSTHRSLIDWISLLGFRTRFFGWLFWDSPLAKVFRSILYTVRRQPFVGKLLYGKAGPPPELGGVDRTRPNV
ncbi:MAG: DUF362 domain-containing protein [Anaerolineales bacterium]|nr:DUF362 domain-containing protein [Anaerolineales bacterium]